MLFWSSVYILSNLTLDGRNPHRKATYLLELHIHIASLWVTLQFNGTSRHCRFLLTIEVFNLDVGYFSHSLTQERAMVNASNIRTSHCPLPWPLDMPQSHLISWAIVTSILSPITILANSALIYGLYTKQHLNTISNKFIVLMSISDLCLGIFVFPLIVVIICLKDTFRSCNFELFVHYIALLFAYFSFFMLMCISTDRYIHVTRLNRYNQFMNPRRMKIATILSFFCSVLIASLSIRFVTVWLQLAVCLSGFSGVSLMFFLYSLVFRKLAIHTEKFKRMLEELGRGESTSRETRKEFSAKKTIRFVLGALLVLYMPYNICSVVWAYHTYDGKVKPPFFLKVMMYWSYTLVFSNGAINAIILGYGNSVVRRFIFNRFRRV